MSLVLPRLEQSVPLVDENGLPTQAFQMWWNTFAANLEKAFTDLSNNVAAIATAQAAAAAAQTTANTVQRDDSISTSWVSPGTSVTASDAGTNATVSIAANTRHYSNTGTVAVNSGSIPGLAYTTPYYVYYDDPSKVGGAVTYHATTDANTSLPGAAVGRHYVGTVTTPAAGGGNTTGSGPAGGGGGSFGGGNIV